MTLGSEANPIFKSDDQRSLHIVGWEDGKLIGRQLDSLSHNGTASTTYLTRPSKKKVSAHAPVPIKRFRQDVIVSTPFGDCTADGLPEYFRGGRLAKPLPYLWARCV
jgi:hypothetical protein